MFGTMRETKKVLDKLKIPFWLDAGTLLFAIRENRCDPQDIDFSISYKNVNKLLSGLNLFLLKGFRIGNVYSYPKKGLVELALIHNNFKVDIFIKFFRGYWAYHITSWPYLIVAKFPNKYFKKFDKFSMDGVKWNVPNNPKKYLFVYYGKDWEIPNPKWKPTDAFCIDKEWII